MHIFGPEGVYPFVEKRSYTPLDALPRTYRHLAARLGIERVVLVQASVYGSDNRRLLSALEEVGIPARAVAVLSLDTSDEELARLHELGVRGIRVIADQPGGLSMGMLPAFSERLAEIGWHLQLMLTPAQLSRFEPTLDALACDFVLDHTSRIAASGGTGQPEFRTFLRLLSKDNGWAKLSASYHCSAAPPPYEDLDVFFQEMLDCAPNRVVWGTDWPHVHFEGEMPNTTDLFDRLERFLPDESALRRVLVENPARLYGF